MHGFIDLHCHWVAAIDDGVRVPEAGVALLRALHAVGFSTVVATPHMRPGKYDNDRASLEAAFQAMRAPIDQAREAGPLPEVHLSSEHWFDDTVYERLRKGEGMPYPSLVSLAAGTVAAGASAGSAPAARPGGWQPPPRKRGVLIEFAPERFPLNGHRRLFDLHRAGLYPVIAHPERYQPVWSGVACLSPYVEAGAHLLLDVCSLVGKYGRAAQKASEVLLDDGAYYAACSDAHKPEDVDEVARGIDRLRQLAGAETVQALLEDGPRAILHMPPRDALTRAPGRSA